MDSANFINFIKNPGSLHQLSFQELNSLIESYPYCQNLHFMVMMKAKVEQHKDFEKKLGVASTYSADRKFLFSQIQNPVRPDSTSDSHYGASEMNPVANDPIAETLHSSTVVVPPIPLLPDDDSEIPEETPHTKDDTLAPENISDQILDPDIIIIEDESGSQLIKKNADMPLHPEDEKRKVVYLEDLFEEKEKIKEIPELIQDKLINDDIPVESEAPVMEPIIEEIEDPNTPLEDDDIFTVESDAVSDLDMGIPISDADTLSDQIDEQELPQENLEGVNPFESGLSTTEEPEEPSIDTDPIPIPDHIIDNIPFEITNAPDGTSDGYNYEEENEFIVEEAFSEEGNDKISEQSTGIPVVDKKIRMDFEEEDENNDANDNLEEPPSDKDGEQSANDENELDIEELTPLPKVAFKSWPGKFKPTTSKTEEVEITPAAETSIEEEKMTNESQLHEEEAIENPEITELLEKEEKSDKKEKRAVDLTKVIKKHKAKKKKKAAKAKKKKKAKKEKEEQRQIESIEEEPRPKAKKKKKKKDKKKKKKRIKQLAEKSLTLSDDIISETLAELLVDQGSNKKAIKMYKKLSLIFPEKSAFFAAQIKKLKK